jgi:hypothetical protein
VYDFSETETSVGREFWWPYQTNATSKLDNIGKLKKFFSSTVHMKLAARLRVGPPFRKFSI